MQLLAGKSAFVAGVGPGLGREVALLFAEHGAKVAVGARTLANCEAVVADIEAAGGTALAVALDVTDRTSCDAAVAAAVEAHGGLDIIVNNAFSDGNFRTFADSDLAEWRSTFDINTFGTLEMTQAALPALEASGDGRVVMINTMSTKNTQPRFGAYAASKAAIEMATRTLAMELGPVGIRVNGIHPGYIWGPNVQAYFAHQAKRRDVDPQVVYDEVASEIALRYIPPAAEIAGTALYLASDLAKPVTGQAINVNGGHHL